MSTLSFSLRPPRAALAAVLEGRGAAPAGDAACSPPWAWGGSWRRVSPHCPRPRHSPPIHLPARQIPAPGHGNICLLLRLQLTCCRLLLRHRPFPPTATGTATAAAVTAVTAMAAPHGVTAGPFAAAGPEPVVVSRWKSHSGNTGICRGTCRAAGRKSQKATAPAGHGPGVVSPSRSGTRGSVGASGEERSSSAVPGAVVGRGHGRGWHWRVPVQRR